MADREKSSGPCHGSDDVKKRPLYSLNLFIEKKEIQEGTAAGGRDRREISGPSLSDRLTSIRKEKIPENKPGEKSKLHFSTGGSQLRRTKKDNAV